MTFASGRFKEARRLGVAHDLDVCHSTQEIRVEIIVRTVGADEDHGVGRQALRIDRVIREVGWTHYDGAGFDGNRARANLVAEGLALHTSQERLVHER